ncbi:hypothetical protein FZEAL_7177 [Fusarium zealandicum]|uniref:Uncharacterized protein n=1 Tax=Fusarium zealandicum TaxID=1053134 RepID=A0A8H4UG92_9HYPO|nr:hypothetical protein FZEAL_7177 [Fusarium zealandicum]
MVYNKPVSDYEAIAQAGSKPEVIFYDEIRRTILNALLDRADNVPRLPDTPGERPPFDKDVTKTVDSKGEAYNSILYAFRNYVKWVLRLAIDYQAFTVAVCGCVWTFATPFKSDTEAGEKPLFSGERRNAPAPLRKLSIQPEATKPAIQLDAWSSEVSAKLGPRGRKKDDLRKRLEKLGQEMQNRLREIKRISEGEAQSWVGI